LHHAHGHEGVEAFEPGGGVFENGKKEGAKLAHSHFHEHHAVFHTHFHYPDIHHEHEHGR
jgi:hypothetical protein